MTLEHKPTSQERTHELELVRQLLEKVGTLIEILPGHMRPERDMRVMEFIPQPHPIYAYPKALQDWLQDKSLAEVLLTATSDEEGFLSTTLEFQAENDPTVLYISRGATPIEQDTLLTTQDCIMQKNGLITPFTPMDNREIDAFLLSVTGSYLNASVQAQSSATTPIITDQILDSLRDNALTSKVSRSFNLASGRIVEYDINLVGNKPQLTSFVLYYETGSDRRLRAAIDCSQGFTLTLSAIDQTIEPLYPDVGDYTRLIELIEEEIAYLQNGYVREIVTDPLALGEIQ